MAKELGARLDKLEKTVEESNEKQLGQIAGNLQEFEKLYCSYLSLQGNSSTVHKDNHSAIKKSP